MDTHSSDHSAEASSEDRQPALRTAPLAQVVERQLPRPDMVTAVIQQKVRPDHRADYEAWLHSVIPVAARFPGHRGVQVIPPAPNAMDYTITIRFDTVDHAEDWFSSDVRKALLQAVAPLLDAPEEVKTVTGLEFWFESPASTPAPKRFKQALVTLSVIFPLTTMLGLILAPQFHFLPGIWARLAGNLAVATLTVFSMTYFIMPRYTRAIHGWLSR